MKTKVLSATVSIPPTLISHLNKAKKEFPLKQGHLHLTDLKKKNFDFILPSFQSNKNYLTADRSQIIHYDKLKSLLTGQYTKLFYERQVSVLEKLASCLKQGLVLVFFLKKRINDLLFHS